VQHIIEFIDLWTRLEDIQLGDGVADKHFLEANRVKEEHCQIRLQDAVFQSYFLSNVAVYLGKLGATKVQFFLIGLLFKIMYGKQTGLLLLDGQIAAFVEAAGNLSAHHVSLLLPSTQF
jgi:hypothetical protein